MRTTAWCFVVIAIAAPGCDFLAPVVVPHAPLSGVPTGCGRPPPPCALLDSPPEAPALPAVGLDSTRCPTRELRTVEVIHDTMLDAGQLGCVDLVIEVAGSTEDVRRVDLSGDLLDDATIEVRSSGPEVQLRLGVHRLRASELSIDGPVMTTLDRVEVSESHIALGSRATLVQPRLTVDGGSLGRTAIDAPRAQVRLRSVAMLESVLAADSLVIDRGRVEDSTLDVGLVEMLAADVASSRLEVDDLIVAAGRLSEVHIARCGRVAISSADVLRSFVARCDRPVEVRAVSFVTSVVRADVVGEDGSLFDSVFAGETLQLSLGSVEQSSFCGTRRVEASSITCMGCEPVAPPDVCAVVTLPIGDHCPGICTSICSISGGPTIDPEACMP